MDITKIDKNFKISTSIQAEGLVFHNCLEAPFRLCGAIYEDGAFRRMPQAIADNVSEGVANLNLCTAGGRIEFVTDSPYIALHVDVNVPGIMSHFAVTGSVGCDLYCKAGGENIYLGTYVPGRNVVETGFYEGLVNIIPLEELGLGDSSLGGSSLGGSSSSGMGDFGSCDLGSCDLGSCEPRNSDLGTPRHYIINLPTYTGATAIFVGLKEGSVLMEAPDYSISKPVVFYGSSITQGGCTSRPGCTYEAQLSRALDFDYLNLGFSGSALAEEGIIDYICGLEMSAFVLDYDHNAPDAEHLKKTHEHFYRKIRQKHPALPIIMMSRPKFRLDAIDLERRAIIVDTYEKAKHEGDANVYLLTGQELIPREMADIALVDNCHPNDAGFYSIARALRPVLEKVLG